jgi:flagellar hook-length control protein FliK
MNQLVAFLVPTSLPNTAGAMARATSAETGETFANMLAQFQAEAQPNATVDASAQPSQLLPQLPTSLPQASNNLSTDDLAAKLQTIAGSAPTTRVVATDAPALLDRPAAMVEPQVPQPDSEMALVSNVAAQLQSQVPTPILTADPAPAAPAPAPVEPGLRGTLSAEQVIAPKTTDTAFNQPAPSTVVERAAPTALLAGGQAPKPEPSTTRSHLAAAPKRTTAEGSSSSHNQATPLEQPEAADEARTPQVAQSWGQSTPSAQGAGQAPAKVDGSPAQPTFAPIAPAQPNVVDAQQTTATVITTPQAAVPLDALAVHIARKFEAGASQFEIRLHPAELGQLDISLSVADDGRVQAVLRAERPETLDILQRDARALEQQLRQAGLEVGSNSLSFSLSSGNGQRQAPFAGWPAFADAQDAAEQAKKEAASTYIAVRQRDGVDIRV